MREYMGWVEFLSDGAAEDDPKNLMNGPEGLY